MALFESRPDEGLVKELTEVELTKSGNYVVILDDEGRQITFHRSIWEQMKATIDAMLAGTYTQHAQIEKE